MVNKNNNNNLKENNTNNKKNNINNKKNNKEKVNNSNNKKNNKEKVNNKKNNKENNKPREERNWKNYFPEMKNVNKTKLQISNVGKYSMSRREDSEQILEKILELFPKTKKDIVITDGTGNMGGDTIRFALSDRIKKVNTFEIDPETFKILENNVKVYGLEKKTELMNEDYCKNWNKVKQDIIFIDAPWGGRKYKKFEMVKLFMGSDCPLNHLVKDLIKEKTAKFIVLKVPFNFAITKLMHEAEIKTVEIDKIERFRPYYLIKIKV